MVSNRTRQRVRLSVRENLTNNISTNVISKASPATLDYDCGFRLQGSLNGDLSTRSSQTRTSFVFCSPCFIELVPHTIVPISDCIETICEKWKVANWHDEPHGEPTATVYRCGIVVQKATTQEFYAVAGGTKLMVPPRTRLVSRGHLLTAH